MPLEIDAFLRAEVVCAAERAYPDECCGALIGPVPEGFDGPGRRLVVRQTRALPNGWEGAEKKRRYLIDGKTLARVELELAGTDQAVIGFYHSHPDAPAWPSPFDLERAWPCYSFLIMSVRSGKAIGARSWVLSPSGDSFIEENLQEPARAPAMKEAS